MRATVYFSMKSKVGKFRNSLILGEPSGPHTRKFDTFLPHKGHSFSALKSVTSTHTRQFNTKPSVQHKFVNSDGFRKLKKNGPCVELTVALVWNWGVNIFELFNTSFVTLDWNPEVKIVLTPQSDKIFKFSPSSSLFVTSIARWKVIDFPSAASTKSRSWFLSINRFSFKQPTTKPSAPFRNKLSFILSSQYNKTFTFQRSDLVLHKLDFAV